MHVKGKPVVLFNVWDAGSARAVARAGSRALGTSSWSVANALGYDDGEQTPLEAVLAVLRRIVAATDLPVTADLETGYGASPADLERSLASALDTGIVGFNIEDGLVAGGRRDAIEQSQRYRAARRVADASGIGAFVNARTDVFLQMPTEAHTDGLDEVLERAKRYADAGADGLFIPGASDPGLIETISARQPLPVNVMATASTPPTEVLAGVGVARVSYGAGPLDATLDRLEKAARQAIGTDCH